MKQLLALVVAASIAAIGLALPTPAVACGGFFCNNTDLIAVDQRKERILFEVNGDGTITAHVEIAYEGSPESFSWVVPVPATPALDIVPASTLTMMDAATSPRIIPPDQYGWEDFADGDGSPPSDDDDGAGGDDDDDEPGVDVEDLPQVGPFDPEVISSDDPQALIDWLNDNGYLITEEMEPLIAEYVTMGMKFLGMKLAPDSGVQDIAPIKMTYASDLPMIPLVLTAVAAEPEMGVLVFIAGAERYETSNYASLFIDDDLLRADPRNGATNYYPLLSYLAEQEFRQAFFTEYSDTSANFSAAVQNVWLGTKDQDDAWAYAAELAERHPHITRLYTRMSAIDMVVDPTFAPAGITTISNVHDLRDQPPVHIDYGVDPDLPCNDNYCGMGGTCATTDSGSEGCACQPDFVARGIASPNVSSVGTRPAVTCQDATFDMMASLMESMGGPGPCADFSCGDFGECQALGGFPTCACDVGYAAVALGGGALVCEAVTASYSDEQILWPDWPTDPDSEDDEATGGFEAQPGQSLEGCSCDASDAPGGRSALGLLLFLAGVAVRRRRA